MRTLDRLSLGPCGGYGALGGHRFLRQISEAEAERALRSCLSETALISPKLDFDACFGGRAHIEEHALLIRDLCVFRFDRIGVGCLGLYFIRLPGAPILPKSRQCPVPLWRPPEAAGRRSSVKTAAEIMRGSQNRAFGPARKRLPSEFS
jgi:hypothetical protein